MLVHSRTLVSSCNNPKYKGQSCEIVSTATPALVKIDAVRWIIPVAKMHSVSCFATVRTLNVPVAHFFVEIKVSAHRNKMHAKNGHSHGGMGAGFVIPNLFDNKETLFLWPMGIHLIWVFFLLLVPSPSLTSLSVELCRSLAALSMPFAFFFAKMLSLLISSFPFGCDYFMPANPFRMSHSLFRFDSFRNGLILVSFLRRSDYGHFFGVCPALVRDSFIVLHCDPAANPQYITTFAN